MNIRLYNMMSKLAAINMAKLIDAIDPARAGAKNVLMHDDPEKMNKMIDALKREGKFDEFLQTLPEGHFNRFLAKANYNRHLSDDDFAKIQHASTLPRSKGVVTPKADAHVPDAKPLTAPENKGSSMDSAASMSERSDPVIGSGAKKSDTPAGGGAASSAGDTEPVIGSGSDPESNTKATNNYAPYLIGGAAATAGAVGLGLRNRKDRENAR